MKFVAFLVTEYDEVFSGYQPGQMVERRTVQWWRSDSGGVCENVINSSGSIEAKNFLTSYISINFCRRLN
jgi:hypothetical protein